MSGTAPRTSRRSDDAVNGQSSLYPPGPSRLMPGKVPVCRRGLETGRKCRLLSTPLVIMQSRERAGRLSRKCEEVSVQSPRPRIAKRIRARAARWQGKGNPLGYPKSFRGGESESTCGCDVRKPRPCPNREDVSLARRHAGGLLQGNDAVGNFDAVLVSRFTQADHSARVFEIPLSTRPDAWAGARWALPGW